MTSRAGAWRSHEPGDGLPDRSCNDLRHIKAVLEEQRVFWQMFEQGQLSLHTRLAKQHAALLAMIEKGLLETPPNDEMATRDDKVMTNPSAEDGDRAKSNGANDAGSKDTVRMCTTECDYRVDSGTENAVHENRSACSAGTSIKQSEDEEVQQEVSEQSMGEVSKDEEARRDVSRRVGLSNALAKLMPDQGEGPFEWRLRLHRSFVSNFDIVMGIVIVSNVVSTFLLLDLMGAEAASSLGRASDKLHMIHMLPAEDLGVILDHLYNIAYFVDFVHRLWALRREYFHDTINVFDALILLFTSVDLYILLPMQIELGAAVAIFRLLRLFKTVRLLRAIRLLTRFGELRILIKAMVASAQSLMWSMVLLLVVLVAGGIFLSQSLIGFIHNEMNDLPTRKWVFKYYGGASRATYTIFEATFSGGWPQYARPLVEKVNPFYVCFWFIYVIAVVFAMTRVIAAMFLKQTLAVAADDAEKAALDRAQTTEKVTIALREFFNTVDTSGDGRLSADEQAKFFAHPDMDAWLEVLDLDVREVKTLFYLLADEEGIVDTEDFLGAAVRMRHAATSMDTIAIMHEQFGLKKKLSYLVDYLVDRLVRSEDASLYL
mmetsp:Transcript_82723/g.230695  ORF Transcript_82723/g.230695 Transcript_82723/m.230695 type:complete len:602 (+) Transcript_82723:127-1932(+)